MVGLDLPEATTVTVWALEHPGLTGLIWLGTTRPETGQRVELAGTRNALRWEESMLVRAELTMTAWRHLPEHDPARCPECHLINGAHTTECGVLAMHQSGGFSPLSPDTWPPA